MVVVVVDSFASFFFRSVGSGGGGGGVARHFCFTGPSARWARIFLVVKKII